MRPVARSSRTGDCLVLYTDGVTEARRDGQLFGEQRLLRTVAGSRGLGAQDSTSLGDAARDYANRLRDDLQILVLRLL